MSAREWLETVLLSSGDGEVFGEGQVRRGVCLPELGRAPRALFSIRHGELFPFLDSPDPATPCEVVRDQRADLSALESLMEAITIVRRRFGCLVEGVDGADYLFVVAGAVTRFNPAESYVRDQLRNYLYEDLGLDESNRVFYVTIVTNGAIHGDDDLTPHTLHFFPSCKLAAQFEVQVETLEFMRNDRYNSRCERRHFSLGPHPPPGNFFAGHVVSYVNGRPSIADNLFCPTAAAPNTVHPVADGRKCYTFAINIDLAPEETFCFLPLRTPMCLPDPVTPWVPRPVCFPSNEGGFSDLARMCEDYLRDADPEQRDARFKLACGLYPDTAECKCIERAQQQGYQEVAKLPRFAAVRPACFWAPCKARGNFVLEKDRAYGCAGTNCANAAEFKNVESSVLENVRQNMLCFTELPSKPGGGGPPPEPDPVKGWWSAWWPVVATAGVGLVFFALFASQGLGNAAFVLGLLIPAWIALVLVQEMAVVVVDTRAVRQTLAEVEGTLAQAGRPVRDHLYCRLKGSVGEETTLALEPTAVSGVRLASLRSFELAEGRLYSVLFVLEMHAEAPGEVQASLMNADGARLAVAEASLESSYFMFRRRLQLALTVDTRPLKTRNQRTLSLAARVLQAAKADVFAASSLTVTQID